MYRLVALATAFAAVLSACTPAASTQPIGPRAPLNPTALVSPWTGAAAMPVPAHDLHMAALLPSGKVLVAGGRTSTARLATAVLYDPSNGTWSFTGALTAARDSATTTLLPTGKVLVVGGAPFAGAELYDPETGTWSPTGSLATARSSHTATLLPSGKVLVAFGYGSDGNALSSAELYDPETGTWTPAGSSGLARLQHTAALLPSGKVLIVGGRSNSFAVLASAEVYDPESDTWATTGSLAAPRFWHVTTALPNGKVLVAGGLGAAGALPATELASAELYDPATGTWGPTGPLGSRRRQAQGALLPNGKFLVVGGWSTEYAAGAELYDPATELWTEVGLLATGRTGHSATALPSGKVLVAAGYASGYLSSAELWSMPGVANSIPIALPQAVTTPEDTRLAIALAGTDADVTPLTYSVRSQPAHGVLSGSGASLVYTPAPDFHGLDGFTFVANDGAADSPVASVSIEVTPVNDAPTAQPQAVVLTEGGSLDVTLAGADVDGDATTFGVVEPPAHGVLAGTGATRTYTPDADFSGTDRFTFTANDGTIDSGAATVEVLVTAVNDAPVAQSLTVATAEDSPLPIVLAAADADGDLLTYEVVTPPAHGTLTGAGVFLAFTPDANYHGPDSFTLKANDGLVDSAAATVEITVTPVNDAPVARPGFVTLPEDASAAVPLVATDAEEDALTYTIVTPPAHGTLTGNGASLAYQPAADYNGPDSFTFVANDGQLDSAPETVTIAVTPVDEPKTSGGCSSGATGDLGPLAALLLGALGLRRRRRLP